MTQTSCFEGVFFPNTGICQAFQLPTSNFDSYAGRRHSTRLNQKFLPDFCYRGDWRIYIRASIISVGRAPIKEKYFLRTAAVAKVGDRLLIWATSVTQVGCRQASLTP